jgi:hypothetical protein
MKRAAVILLFAVLLSSPAFAADEGWHKSLEEGRKAARKSGKPILVVTVWAPNI